MTDDDEALTWMNLQGPEWIEACVVDTVSEFVRPAT